MVEQANSIPKIPGLNPGRAQRELKTQAMVV